MTINALLVLSREGTSSARWRIASTTRRPPRQSAVIDRTSVANFNTITHNAARSKLLQWIRLAEASGAVCITFEGRKCRSTVSRADPEEGGDEQNEPGQTDPMPPLD